VGGKRLRLCDRGVDGLLGRGVGADVAHPEFGFEFPAFVVGQVGDHHFGACADQTAHRRFSQPASASDDQGRASGNLH
jgi:hypothetical protein